MAPTRIGPYKILDILGAGGMGVVYLAEQTEPVKRRVALKIIKLGMDSQAVLARFEAEEQALALMNHPNVAKVFDAGTTEQGRPYFVMEHVPGISITDYCDKERLRTSERLGLFMQVCDAIQHAHHNGIIHRDIKPSNVLVAIRDGKPALKVIDFGVAKAMKHRLTERTLFTELGQIVGTPEYMSPEQAEMSGLNIDARTDIYSLGVLLYVLLSGALPFEPESLRRAAFHEIQRMIREDEPPKPSTRLSGLGDVSGRVAHDRRTDPSSLERQLRGDLDWITMKAMDKSRTRRYASASELAADLQRYLEHEPVVAGPPGAAYRLQKFVRRHRAGVAATAAVTLALVAGIVGTSWMAAIASRQRAEALTAKSEAEGARQAESEQRTLAQREAAIARAVNDFLNNDLLGAVAPGRRGRDITVREVLDTASRKIEGTFVGEPLVEASIHLTLAETYWRLGEYEAAEPHAKESLALQQAELGEEHSETLDAMNTLAMIYKYRGRYAEAEDLYIKALETCRRILGDEDRITLSSMINLAVLLREQARLDEAEPLYREALSASRRVLGDEDPDTLTVMVNLADVLRETGRLNEAESLAREARKTSHSALGQDHPCTLQSMYALARILVRRDKDVDAESLLRRTLEVARRVFGDEHPRVATIRKELASLLVGRGDYEPAELLLRATLATRQERLGEDHWKTGKTRSDLGECLTKLGRYEEAERTLLAAHRTLVAAGSDNHRWTAIAVERLAALYDAWGRPGDAAEWRARLETEDSAAKRSRRNE